MPLFDSLSKEELEILLSFVKPVVFPKDACILKQGDPGDGCYYIDEGDVRLELVHTETDSESVLCHIGPGSFLGEFSLCDNEPRSASAYADTVVKARWLGREEFDGLCAKHPQIGVKMMQSLAGNLTGKLRVMNKRVSEYIFMEDIDQATNATVARAVAAQAAFATWPETKVDALLQDIADTIAGQSESFAIDAVQETHMGNVPDKTIKTRFAAEQVARSLVGRTGSGIVHVDENNRITEFASPAGVVLGLLPVTNPVSTLVFKTLICLKGRNALILSSHRGAAGVCARAGTLVRDVIARHGASADLVQWIQGRTSRHATAMFMKHRDVKLILATGGPSVVKAAYSSGIPAIGVGAGNAPCWIAPDADVEAAAACVVRSKSFDCGVICGSENNLVADASIRAQFVQALEKEGAAVLTPDEARRFAAMIFDPEGGHLLKEFIGRPAAETAERGGIKRPYPIRLIVIPGGPQDASGSLGLEKLAPMLSLFTVTGESEALALCCRILKRCGQGHTAVVHTRSEETARRYAREIPASRVLVNVPSAQGCVGFGTGLTPSFTLGCGTFGGNSTSDNVTFTHLLNLKRLAQPKA